jgi:hypothetical protein
MGTAPRKQLKHKSLKHKQLKRTYKIPRSLKKSIKKNLAKIVKKRECKIRDEEVSLSLALPTTSYIAYRLFSALLSHSRLHQPYTDYLQSYSARSPPSSMEPLCSRFKIISMLSKNFVPPIS